MYVEDVKDRSNIPKGCNAMYVEDVKDVKDRSNTPKGCNAMYVEDGKRTYRHTFIIPFLIWYHLNIILCMLKMSKIDQIHLRAVMLCMSKHVEDVKDYLQHLRHALIYTVFDGMVEKPSVLAFQNFFRIENPLILESWDSGLFNHTIKCYICRHLRH